MKDITYKPDFNAWGKLGYELEETTVRDNFRQWELTHYSNGGFQCDSIVIDFDLKKGPGSIRVFRTLSTFVDPSHEIPMTNKDEIDLAEKERDRIKGFLSNLEAE